MSVVKNLNKKSECITYAQSFEIYHDAEIVSSSMTLLPSIDNHQNSIVSAARTQFIVWDIRESVFGINAASKKFRAISYSIVNSTTIRIIQTVKTIQHRRPINFRVIAQNFALSYVLNTGN